MLHHIRCDLDICLCQTSWHNTRHDWDMNSHETFVRTRYGIINQCSRLNEAPSNSAAVEHVVWLFCHNIFFALCFHLPYPVHDFIFVWFQLDLKPSGRLLVQVRHFKDSEGGRNEIMAVVRSQECCCTNLRFCC